MRANDGRVMVSVHVGGVVTTTPWRSGGHDRHVVVATSLFGRDVCVGRARREGGGARVGKAMRVVAVVSEGERQVRRARREGV